MNRTSSRNLHVEKTLYVTLIITDINHKSAGSVPVERTLSVALLNEVVCSDCLHDGILPLIYIEMIKHG